MLNEKKTPELPGDETMLYCLVECCRFNDREGGCRAEGGVIQIMTIDGRPGCEEFEPDPYYMEIARVKM